MTPRSTRIVLASPETPSVIQADAGSPLGSDRNRERPSGRIGGLVGFSNPDQTKRTRLLQALGPQARLLSRESSPVADWDCCRLGSSPIGGLKEWQTVIAQGQISEVTGAFALAWQEEDETVYLARDALGERTLFYLQIDGGLAFASTLQALLATGLPERKLNRVGVARYLSYAYLPGSETLIEGIHEVLPGELIRWRSPELTRKKFWTIPSGHDPDRRHHHGHRRDEKELKHELRSCLESAVRKLLPEREPIGATLSGGLDSSLVVAVARSLHDRPVHTFSISFGSDYPNELAYSSLVAEHCSTEHRIVELKPGVVAHHLDETISLLSKPIGDPLTVPNALCFRQAAQEVGVVLNGEGGDPAFGGPKNLPMLLAELFGDGAKTEIEDAYDRERSYLRAHKKCYDDLEQMMTPNLADALSEAPLEEELVPHLRDPRFSSFVNRLMSLNVSFKGAHHILPKVDALSAPFGILSRSPLFDRSVIETAFIIPPQLKLKGSVEKYLLKESVKDLLPRTILERPKCGMLVPVEAWFRGPMVSQARERLLDGLTPFDLIKRSYLEGLFRHRPNRLSTRRGAKIWLLITLEAWLRKIFLP